MGIHPELQKPVQKERGFLSKFFAWWVVPVIRLGNKKELELEDLHDIPRKHSNGILSPALGAEWKIECEREPRMPSLVKALLRTFGRRFAWITLTSVLSDTARLSQSVLLWYLLLYFDGGSPDSVGYGLGLGLILVFSMASSTRQGVSFDSMVLGMDVRVAVSGLVYDKAFRLSQQALAASSVGQVTNYLSNDVNRYDMALQFLPNLFSCPVQILTSVGLLLYYVGVSGFAGLGLFLLLLPAQSLLGRASGRLRAQVAKRTDARLKFMTELLNGILLVKISTWENIFGSLIGEARKQEMREIRSKFRLLALNSAIFDSSIKLVVLVSLVVYIGLGNVLSSEATFFMLSIYNNLRVLISRQFPTAISSFSELLVSSKRIEGFLLLEERQARKENEDGAPGVFLRGVTASWTNDGEPCIRSACLSAESGQLIGITGPVGSGKSSLLQVILGELPTSGGEVEVRGQVAYAPQEPFLFPGSIRDNIIFGLPFDQPWFEQVVEACALTKDMASLPHADQTLVGERGLRLSGGQKSRVNLARAIYSRADIYLLDDPFSSVDTRVGFHLLEKCLNGLLKTKSVILVTHQARYLEGASSKVTMDKGKVIHVDSFHEALSSTDDDTTVDNLIMEEDCGKTTESLMQQIHQEGQNGVIKKESAYGTFRSDSKAVDAEKEGRSVGSLPWSLYMEFLLAGNGIILTLVLVGLLVLAQVIFSGADVWLKFWIDSVSDPSEPSRNNYFLIGYASLNVALFIVGLARSQMFFSMLLTSSVRLHMKAVGAILRAPMAFFEVNPVGRIMNRFSNDVGNLDELIPNTAFFFTTALIQSIGAIGVAIFGCPILILPSLVLLVLMLWVRRFYLRAGSGLKRLEAISRAPVFEQMTTTLSGLAVLRGFGAELYFQRKFQEALDRHTSAYYTFLSVFRWCSMTVLTIVNVYTAIIIAALFFSSAESSTAGLVISSALALNTVLAWNVTQSVDLANQMVSVERVLEYSKIRPERALKVVGREPPRDWPRHGSFLLHGVHMKYGQSPHAIRDISLNIKAGEKVGIVGRTGAGKSSLMTAIFRLVEPDLGSIHLDGINLLHIGLHDFRSKISFIPQNPILFTGTMRTNLDPLGSKGDFMLWESLSKVNLSERVRTAGGLDSQVAEGGGNFSQGEKQLICLARSLLSQNRILILDEATAHVDPETEIILQAVITECLSNCTVITIAHRLDTVMKSDRVCVVEAGNVVEFDSPLALLNQGKGRLFELVQKSGNSAAERLSKIAEKAAHGQVQRGTKYELN